MNDANAYQTWEGFGGAFNEKGWSYLTSQQMKDQAIALLFGKDGCNFAWGRIPIGASDYAMDRYSLNETAGDTTMSMFSIARDKMKLIPYIKAAQAVKSNIRFWASPWSPPTWMKTGPYNPNTGASHSNFDGGVMKSDDATLKAFALYLVKFVQAYAAEGINVEVVSPQNEPNYQQNYPSCHWDSATFVSFVGKYLGPALTSANLTTKVMDGTLSNPSGDADIGQSVLRDATAKGYVKSIGVQWGMADSGPVNTLKGLAGGIPLWLSETKCGGTIGSTAPAPNDFNYGRDTWGYISGAIKNGLTAYNAWNMVLDKGGLGIDDTRKWPQNALLVADSGTRDGDPGLLRLPALLSVRRPRGEARRRNGRRRDRVQEPGRQPGGDHVQQRRRQQQLRRFDRRQEGAVRDARQRLGDDQVRALTRGRAVRRWRGPADGGLFLDHSG